MKIFRAILAGFAGALAMSAAMYLLRSSGIPVSLEDLLGSLVSPNSPWWAGFGMHLAIGCIVGLAYAAAFEMAMQASGPLVGGGLGFSHAMLAGLCMSGIPAMNPFSGGGAGAPGAFLSNIQFGPPIFFALHVLFGAVVGVVYGSPVEQPHGMERELERPAH